MPEIMAKAKEKGVTVQERYSRCWLRAVVVGGGVVVVGGGVVVGAVVVVDLVAVVVAVVGAVGFDMSLIAIGVSLFFFR